MADQTNSQPVSEPSSIPKKKKSSWWRNLSDKQRMTINIIGGLLLVITIGTSAFWFGKNNNPKPSPSPSPDLNLQMQLPQQDKEEELTEPTISPSASPSASPNSSPTPTPEESTTSSKQLSADPNLDGFRASNNGGNNGVEIRVGRNNTLITRGFVSFDLNDIPDGATITKVILRLYQAGIVGDPLGEGLRVMIDHLEYGDSLGSDDYSASSLSSNFATFADTPTIEWKQVDVTDQVKADISASRSRSQFRLHFATENTGGDATGDKILYESADNTEGTGNTPQLMVEYEE